MLYDCGKVNGSEHRSGELDGELTNRDAINMCVANTKRWT